MIQFKENIIIAPYTVFKIGGPADFFCEVKNKEELKEALAWANGKGIKVFIIGGGSNILVSDNGFRGLAILNNIKGILAVLRGDFSEITFGAGEEWDDFVNYAVERGFAGVECLSGIPGKVGAALMQNIGAYGQSVDKAFARATVIDIKTGEERIFQKEECGLSYRTSRFKTTDRGRYVIADVTFSLKSGDPMVSYHDLKSYFIDGSKKPILTEVRNAVLEIRNKKGMLVTGGGNFLKSAGSFFVNPIIPKDAIGKLRPLAAACNASNPNQCKEPWSWEQKDGRYKISAACLMNLAGFEKGMRTGSVGISSYHTLALVNYGEATASEVKNLALEIQKAVKEKFGIDLEIEPDII
ncbi:MAG: UDP-N-acetylenolpyruvoylglucosamine reductase [Candidatus Giovannonibacteria bacterium GW2011_GWA2_44_13b]|uniref:UDP-N-acetylenolpyruvoylglucosamine reductase n=2 Tax=Candidatus Giovannoniibacteriota TaxID=1752738 RepID=A0A0G1K1F9_9BACT|nr:MAG: UDP-N-acetylenolpyruvoylglucosamine reductase [Candidatus Giovannonibacteria bacterium GW2011_GWA2_44_13b]OGF82986.1 MAG: UDP-N-acetylenolpyruvoylglucosamine reductase [Candidatus Giovannonibacteria bacterium RIFCSPLOWO2_01_FULL_44_16]